MRLPSFILVVVAVIGIPATPAGAQESPCTAALPPGGAYDVVRTMTDHDFLAVLEEYAYESDWSKHHEALDAGFSIGMLVYDVPLKLGGQFTKEQRDAWKHQYEKRRSQTVVDKLKTFSESRIMRADVIALVTNCISETTSFGLWAGYRPVDDCNFTFRARYRSDLRKADAVHPTRLTVRNGRCDDWSASALSPRGDSVACKRSGRSGVILILDTDQAGAAEGYVPSLPPLGQEPKPPVCETKPVKPQQKEVKIQRPQWQDGGKIYDGNIVFYDFSVDGPITSIEDFGCVEGTCGWIHACPDGGKCGRPRFSQVNAKGEGDCSGQTACRAWSFLNASDANVTRIVVHYLVNDEVCTPPRDEYEKQKTAWEENSRRTCAVLKDSPPQIIGRRFP